MLRTEKEKKKKRRAAAFVLVGTEQKQTRPVKSRGRGEPGDKEQMEWDEGTEKQICKKYKCDEVNAKSE